MAKETHLSLVVLGDKGHKGLVRLSLVTNVTAEGDGVEATSVETGFVDVTDVDLHGSMVLGSDQALGPRALAGDVEVDVVASGVLHG
eukprot:CAMPEP_0185601038 /NCGR_PEP_ID=MMETSP0436-20130131/828_1 /TAXON_ID=626734 ORGANISM="Favella taraikaensis, Strain Fe Narragansett Bay" /NCGR_SAMPLE_ID=MMETSP0436 /ASSEMBLY_ACC=CAM_ASM_000390 /LENGTH=86 /DNA_ID=CAMNT_0028230889 /DNA_START=13 /DNA_END=273 /DNA_ORIENTATION=-